MLLQQIDCPGAAILAVAGRLDNTSAQELETTVLAKLDQGIRNLIMDFSELEYINSAGLRVLVMCYQRLQPGGGQVTICGVRDYIAEVFDISGYNRIFRMCPSREQALSDLEAMPDGQ